MGTEASLALPSVRIFLVPQPTTVGITEFFFFPEKIIFPEKKVSQ